jgi:parallel beta-helix repeat protein
VKVIRGRSVGFGALVVAFSLLLCGCSQTPPPSPTTPTQTPSDVATSAGPQPEKTEGTGERACTVTVEPGSDLSDVASNQPEGAVVCLAPGRFSVSRPIRPKASQTFRGSPDTVLAGDVPVGNWTQEGTRWVAKGHLPADYEKSGQCEDDISNPCQVAETLFVDGDAVRRVMSKDAVDTTSFYADYSANVLYLGQDPTGRAVTLARTRTAITSTEPGVVIERLTVRAFANLPQLGAIVVEGNGWTVRDSTITANHGVGILLVKSDDTQITGNTIIENGQLGLGQYRSQRAKIKNNRIVRNNTAEFWRADWESGGIKVTRSSSDISHNDISNNLGVGVWIDVAGDGVTIGNNTITGNAADGVRYEISRNGRIEGNAVTNNGLALKRGAGTGLLTGAGITVNTSSDVTITGNAVAGNLNGIGIQARPRGEGPWGEYVLENVLVEENIVDLAAPNTATTGYVESGTLAGPVDLKGIRFQGNRYVLGDEGSARFNLKGKSLDFKAWQAEGNDTAGAVVQK